MDIPVQGLFADQKWIDLVPGIFDKVKLLKNPGFNVGFWNLHSRKLIEENGTYRVGEKKIPLVFFHFSGLKFEEEIGYSAYQNRINYLDEPALEKLIHSYVDLIYKNGHRQYKALSSTPVLKPADNDAESKLDMVVDTKLNGFAFNPYRELERLKNKDMKVMRILKHPVIKCVVYILQLINKDKSFGRLDE